MSVIYYTSLILGAAFLNLTKRRRDSTCSSALPRVHVQHLHEPVHENRNLG